MRLGAYTRRLHAIIEAARYLHRATRPTGIYLVGINTRTCTRPVVALVRRLRHRIEKASNTPPWPHTVAPPDRFGSSHRRNMPYCAAGDACVISKTMPGKATAPKLRVPSAGRRCGARPENHSAKCLIRNDEITSPRRTSIDETSGCAIKSDRAQVRGSDPPSGHSVHNTAGDMWRALARRLIQKHLCRCCVENRRQKSSIPLRWQQKCFFFFQVSKKSAGRRGQPLTCFLP